MTKMNIRLRSCNVLSTRRAKLLLMLNRKPLDPFRKIGFVLQLIQLKIVVAFSSIRKIEDRSVSLRGGATLVSVQLAQFGQHASDRLCGSFRFL